MDDDEGHAAGVGPGPEAAAAEVDQAFIEAVTSMVERVEEGETTWVKVAYLNDWTGPQIMSMVRNLQSRLTAMVRQAAAAGVGIMGIDADFTVERLAEFHIIGEVVMYDGDTECERKVRREYVLEAYSPNERERAQQILARFYLWVMESKVRQVAAAEAEIRKAQLSARVGDPTAGGVLMQPNRQQRRAAEGKGRGR